MNWYAYWTAYAVVIAVLLLGCIAIIAHSLWQAYVEFGNREGLVNMRPPPPVGHRSVSYRGWTCRFDKNAPEFGLKCYYAIIGTLLNINAPYVTANTWEELLDAIDGYMEAERLR